ncbi:unnamed protein product [Mucor hiemalis]
MHPGAITVLKVIRQRRRYPEATTAYPLPKAPKGTSTRTKGLARVDTWVGSLIVWSTTRTPPYECGGRTAVLTIPNGIGSSPIAGLEGSLRENLSHLGDKFPRQ